MKHLEKTKQMIDELFATQIQAVLATVYQQQPYTSLMAFTATPDLKQLIFATNRATFKYSNLITNSKAAMLIDNRSGQAWDHYGGIAVTAKGDVQEVDAAEKDSLLALYTHKHPTLEDFAMSPDCALMSMRVDCYYLISRFHDVTELRMRE